MARWDRPNVAIIHVDNEDFDLEGARRDAVSMRQATVFNATPLAEPIANKRDANKHLVKHGVPVPAIMTEATRSVFSNQLVSSGAEVQVVEAGQGLDPQRYNTEFIDTRVTHEGRDYFCCLRLMCINSITVSVHCRFRSVDEGSPSVHNKDTPRDPELIEAMHAKLVGPHRQQLNALAKAVYSALGNGFYAHDVLVERDTGRLHVTETGFKFHNNSLEDHFAEIASGLPSYADLFDGAAHRASAQAFVLELTRLGVLPVR